MIQALGPLGLKEPLDVRAEVWGSWSDPLDLRPVGRGHGVVVEQLVTCREAFRACWGIHLAVAISHLHNDSYTDVVTGAGTGGGSGVKAYLGKELVAVPDTPDLDFDAFAGFTGGVFVG